jgi:ankyrin repeat protein
VNQDQQLLDAAFICDLVRARELLAGGASPDARDEEGRTPLFSAVLGNSVALLGLLLESKADVNARDQHGWTALHYAAQEHLPELAGILVARGADANAQDAEGRSVLWRAVFSARGRGDMIRLLRRAGARDDLADGEGVTPKQLAERLGDPVFTAN